MGKVKRGKVAGRGEESPEGTCEEARDLLAFLDALLADICSTSDPIMRVN